MTRASSRRAQASGEAFTPVALIIPGAPRTKKNSLRRKMVGKFLKSLPSEAWCKWREDVLPRLMQWARQNKHAPIARPVNCAALFYRDALRGDACGYYQGLGDVLQEAGIVADDKWIVSWDGSRLRKDADDPRVEFVLTLADEN